MSWQLTRHSVWPDIYADNASSDNDDNGDDNEDYRDNNRVKNDAADDRHTFYTEVLKES